MIVEGIRAVEHGLDCALAFHAGSCALASEEARSGEDGKAEHHAKGLGILGKGDRGRDGERERSVGGGCSTDASILAQPSALIDKSHRPWTIT